MKKNRIALHTMVIYNTPAIISTVELFGEYETMVMFEDGDELECIRTKNLEDAKETHNRLVREYNDKIYEGSIAKLIGALNYGQFVKTVKAC